MNRIPCLVLGLLLLSFITAEVAVSQKRSLKLRVGSPVTVGDNFLSKYDGVIGGGLTYNQPVSSRWLLRPSVGYMRLNLDDTRATANVLSLRAGIGYSVPITGSLNVIPEVGIGYTRFSFQLHGATPGATLGGRPPGGQLPGDDWRSNSLSTWLAINPTLSLDSATEIGISFGYKAAFLEAPETALDRSYNRRLHALVFGITLTYGL